MQLHAFVNWLALKKLSTSVMNQLIKPADEFNLLPPTRLCSRVDNRSNEDKSEQTNE